MAAKKAILLRLDVGVHEAIRRWADDELRSVNAQVEYLLRRLLLESGRLKDLKDLKDLEDLRDRRSAEDERTS
jgi:hypothetical protein